MLIEAHDKLHDWTKKWIFYMKRPERLCHLALKVLIE